MKLSFKIERGPASVSVSADDQPAPAAPLKPDPKADQNNPRGYYVYAHVDQIGSPFYIGKGTGRRAWRDDRHELWHFYVDRRLGGTYSVKILNDNLSSEEAEVLEAEWMALRPETLVNWINLSRPFLDAQLDTYWRLRRANETLIAEASHVEKSAPDRAIALYRQAIDKLADYADLDGHSGLIGQLLTEQRQERGSNGNVAIIDRLTLCLIRAGLKDEATAAAMHTSDAIEVILRSWPVPQW